MLLDRHRVARLVELSGLERTVKGPERVLREDDVAVLVKAAYDDATDEARAAFMQRIQRLPTSAWPWSAVQVPSTATVAATTIGGVVAAPKPAATPPALILLRGQAESADVDPANRLPDRGTPAALEWEPLHKALDAWDTQTILKAIGPQGWVSIIGNTSGQVSKETGTGTTNGTTNGTANTTPGGTTNGSTSGTPNGSTNGSTSGPPAGGKAPSVDLPAPQEPTSPPAISWKHPAVIAAGAAVVVAVGGVVVYNLGQGHKRSRLEEALGRQGEES